MGKFLTIVRLSLVLSLAIVVNGVTYYCGLGKTYNNYETTILSECASVAHAAVLDNYPNLRSANGKSLTLHDGVDFTKIRSAERSVARKTRQAKARFARSGSVKRGSSRNLERNGTAISGDSDSEVLDVELDTQVKELTSEVVQNQRELSISERCRHCTCCGCCGFNSCTPSYYSCRRRELELVGIDGRELQSGGEDVRSFAEDEWLICISNELNDFDNAVSECRVVLD